MPLIGMIPGEEGEGILERSSITKAPPPILVSPSWVGASAFPHTADHPETAAEVRADRPH